MHFRELSLTFTRPCTLFHAEYWRKVLILGVLNKSLHIHFKDQIAVYDGRSQRFFRILNDIEEMKKRVVSFPPNHRLYALSMCTSFRKQVQRMRKLMGKKWKDDDLWKAHTQVCGILERIYLWYTLSLFLPGPWADGYRSTHGKKANPVLRRLYANRVYSEGLMKEFSNFVKACALQRLKTLGINLDPTLLLQSEVEALLKSNVIPSAPAIAQRRHGYVLIGGKLVFTKDIPSLFRKHGYFFTEPSGTGKSIQGTPTYRSKPLRGRVRLIFSEKEVGAFRFGEILVTQMTDPDCIAAIRKARAIITDEGGITCHAAIISRELKIPCIVGTKIATKVLKDGDRVEVDPGKGVIRKT